MFKAQRNIHKSKHRRHHLRCEGPLSRCEDLAEIIWCNRQQIRQLEMIHEGLNIPSQETSMNILPELSDGLNMLLDSLVKSSFVIEKQPPQVKTGRTP